MHREEVAALDPSRYGLADRSQSYNVNGILWNKPVLQGDEPAAQVAEDDHLTLDDIVKRLRSTYIGRIAFEYMHSPDKSERLWWSYLLESESGLAKREYDVEAKKRILELMSRSETFDHFLQAKFPSLKRYGLEGAESMLPALDSLFRVGALGMLYCLNKFKNGDIDLTLAVQLAWRISYCACLTEVSHSLFRKPP